MSVTCEYCVVRYRCVRRADHSSMGVLPSACVSLSVFRCNDNLYIYIVTVEVVRLGKKERLKRKHDIRNNVFYTGILFNRKVVLKNNVRRVVFPSTK
jgi:hypothetical protein